MLEALGACDGDARAAVRWQLAFAGMARMLDDLGVRSLRLMTNNPDKSEALARHGLRVDERVAMPVEAGEHNLHYLRTKRDRMGHELPWLEAQNASPCGNQ